MAKHIHADDAMNWAFAHLEDPDFNDPPVLAPSSGAVGGTGGTGTDTDTGSGSGVKRENIERLMELGVNEIEAEPALNATDL